ncbi:hypothetical protein D3C86_1536500 [compost metagenome]
MFLLITPMIAVTQKFFSGMSHTAVATLPPGFKTLAISLAANCMSGKNMKPNRQLMASKESSANGRLLTSQTRVSIFGIFLILAFSAAISNMSSARSVRITFPVPNVEAMVNPGSPVPDAISSTISLLLRLSNRTISSPTGFKKSMVSSSHFFQPDENLFHTSFCWSRIISSSCSIIL